MFVKLVTAIFAAVGVDGHWCLGQTKQSARIIALVIIYGKTVGY